METTLYDTTRRDGCQGRSMSLCLEANQGYHYESAEGSFELTARRLDPAYKPPFSVRAAEATVKLEVDSEIVHVVSEGAGLVQPIDRALRKAVLPCFPEFARVRLVEYMVRILDTESATDATPYVGGSYGRRRTLVQWGSLQQHGRICSGSDRQSGVVPFATPNPAVPE